MWAVLLVALLLALPVRVEAAITASFLTHGNGTLASTPKHIDSATVTPVAGQLILVWTSNANNNATCLSGTGGLNTTWTRLQELGANGGAIALWRAVASSSTPGVLTITSAGSGFPICSVGGNADPVAWVIMTFAGVNTTTNQGVVQSNTTFDNGSVTSKVCTLSAFARSTNATVYGALQKTNNTTFTPAGGYTGVTDAAAATGTLGVEFQASADTAPTGTFGAAGPIVVNCAELAETVAIRRHRVYQQ